MKKIMFGAVAFAVLGLASCSSSKNQDADTASLSDSQEVEVATDTVVGVAVDSISPDSAVINVVEGTSETVTPVQK